MNQSQKAAIYRKAAEIMLSGQQCDSLFYLTLAKACGPSGSTEAERDAVYGQIRGPAVDLFMGEAFGTSEELSLAYLLIAAMIEAGDA